MQPFYCFDNNLICIVYVKIYKLTFLITRITAFIKAKLKLDSRTCEH